MAIRQKIVEYRERLDRTLASHALVDEKSIKNLVRNQLIHSSTSDTHETIETFLDKRTNEVSNFLDMMRSASLNEKNVPKNDVIPQRDWKLKTDNEDFRVMYREGPEGTPFHTLLVEGYVDGPIDVCLCLSWEAALFKKWWPQSSIPPFKITTSDCLKDIRIGEQIIQMRVKVAWPLSARETILHYFEVEYLEDDLIIVLLKSISDPEGIDISTHGFTRDGIPDADDFVRVDMLGGFVFQKVTSDISYFRTIATMDIKLDFVPPSLINFFSRQIIGSGFKLFKKTVASVAKGDGEFGKVLNAPVYVRVRECMSMTPKNKLKKAQKPESPENDKSASLCLEGLATKTPQVDIMVIEQIKSDSHSTTSSQEILSIPSKTYNGEIEEVDEEQEIQSEKKVQVSHGKIEVVVERETYLKENKIIDHSTTTLSGANGSNEKTVISPEVEHALRVLDNAIAMVRKGFSMQNWSGIGCNNQELVHLEKVATEVGSISSDDRSDDGVSLKAPKVDNMEALWEDGSSSGFFDIRHDKQDSPPQGMNNNRTSPASPKRHSTPVNATPDGNGKMLGAPALDKMSKDFKEVTVGKLKQKKPRRCCIYFFSAVK